LVSDDSEFITDGLTELGIIGEKLQVFPTVVWDAKKEGVWGFSKENPLRRLAISSGDPNSLKVLGPVTVLNFSMNSCRVTLPD
jgi:hypothetical protein